MPMFKLKSMNTDGIEGGGYQSDQIDKRLLQNIFFFKYNLFSSKIIVENVEWGKWKFFLLSLRWFYVSIVRWRFFIIHNY